MAEKRICSYPGCTTILAEINPGPFCFLHQEKMEEKVWHGGETQVTVIFHRLGDVTLFYWDSPEALEEAREEGDTLVEIEIEKVDLDALRNLTEMLHRLQDEGNISCGDSSLLSNVIPTIIAKAIEKRG